MIREIDSKATGKTRRLLELAKENNALFVCKNVDHMRYKAHEYGITGIDFLSYGQYADGYSLYAIMEHKPVVIDELEDFMSFGCTNVIGYSISKD